MFAKVECSLNDLLGEGYVRSLKECSVRLFGADIDEMDRLLLEKVDFFPEDFEKGMNGDLDAVGTQIVTPFENKMDGAPTDSFRGAAIAGMSPVGGKGVFRVGEDGKFDQSRHR